MWTVGLGCEGFRWRASSRPRVWQQNENQLLWSVGTEDENSLDVPGTTWTGDEREHARHPAIMPGLRFMQGIAECGHDLRVRGNYDVHVRQDRQRPPAAGAARNKN